MRSAGARPLAVQGIPIVDRLKGKFVGAPDLPAAPELLPKKKRKEQRVFLFPEVWDQLTECAEFLTAAVEAVGEEQLKKLGRGLETISRNDTIESFLTWAMQRFWEDKGGKPESERDRSEKVKRHSEVVRRRLEEEVAEQTRKEPRKSS